MPPAAPLLNVGMPSWLKQEELETAPTQQEAAPSPSETSTEEAVPNWMAGLGAEEEAPAAPTPEAAPSLPEASMEEAAPDWMAGTDVQEETPAALASEEATPSLQPEAGAKQAATDWLAGLEVRGVVGGGCGCRNRNARLDELAGF